MKSLICGVAAAAFFVAPAMAASTPVDAPEPEPCVTWEMASHDLTAQYFAWWRMPLDRTFGAGSDDVRAFFFYEALGILYMGTEFVDGCVSEPWPVAEVFPLK